jgi:hypothetical protein
MFATGENDSDKNSREDIAFIVCFNWKTIDRLKEAVQVYLSSRLDEGNDCTSKSGRISKTGATHLDASDMFSVRLIIAGNPLTPPNVLDYLAKRSMRFPTLLERIADNPNTSKRTLRQLACHPAASVRAAVAENVTAPAEALEILVTDDDIDVRYRLAENPNVQMAILESLTEDSNPYVAERARRTINRLTAQAVVTAKFPEALPIQKKRRNTGTH